MADKDSDLALGAGTVPDPFGLTWEAEGQAVNEERSDTKAPGTFAEATDRDEDSAPGTPEDDPVRLGDLD